MRFIFKTDYEQDIRLAKHSGHVFWYGLLLAFLVVAPWLLDEYWLAQLTFVLIYSVVGLGLMLLAGFTGLFSIGHAAFLGVGAYTEAVLAESYSDFSLAKTRFEQLLEIAPPDDPYYERARRKLSRYVTKEELPR